MAEGIRIREHVLYNSLNLNSTQAGPITPERGTHNTL